ncbi:hypothetical protein CALCODRAFT_556465 [Calocera cornea HHB12733]|uniref:Uncharacterized protein n=1 Tax=Calocera cornea HHB12733 TaxID=1353952 RepID=A0A165ER40_9BASI|nr:hypothetical protein CALCODRAFT_556465 [Calocera cornea HHB12733]
MAANILYEKRTWNVGDLKDRIEASPSSFTRFSVVRITHVKDLDSWLWHEYLQIILRDSDNSNLIRIVAERRTDNDHVVIGRWDAWREGTTPPNGDGDTDYPLALFTLEFHKNRPPLRQFAWLLSAVHDSCPEYNIVTANCYWYALTVYSSIYSLYWDTATERKWSWWFYRYFPPSIIPWWDLVTVPLMELSASAFKKDDMKEKEYPKMSGFHVTDDKANPAKDIKSMPARVAVNFWLGVQKRVAAESESYHSTLGSPELPTGTLTAEDIAATLPEPSEFSGIPHPVSHPDGEPDKCYPFRDQVHSICKVFFDDPLLEDYIKAADEQGFDKIFTPLSVKNIPPEYQEMLDAAGPEMLDPGSQLTQKDCDDLNKAVKACVGAVRMKQSPV